MFPQYCANKSNDEYKMTTYWSREQINILIQLYRDHHCLYDVKNKDYKNKRARKIALKEIQEEILPLRPATTIEEIKAKLHGLRTTFMAEHKKVLASQTGPAEDIYQPTVWYYPLMLFVIKYANPRISFQQGNSLFVTDATSRSSETQSLAEDLHEQKPQLDISYDTVESPKLEESYYDTDRQEFQAHPTFPTFKRKAEDQLSSSRDSNSGKNLKSSPCDIPKRVAAYSVNRTQAQTSVPNSNSTDAFVAFVASKLAAFEEDEDVLQEAEERITQVLFELQRRLRNKKASTSD